MRGILALIVLALATASCWAIGKGREGSVLVINPNHLPGCESIIDRKMFHPCFDAADGPVGKDTDVLTWEGNLLSKGTNHSGDPVGPPVDVPGWTRIK